MFFSFSYFFFNTRQHRWWWMLHLKQVDLHQIKRLQSPMVVFTRCPRTNKWGENKNSRIPVSETTQTLFCSFSGVVIPGHRQGWTKSEPTNGIVRWERLHTRWQLIICVAISRVWALALSSEPLVHAIPLLIPPGRLAPPSCRVKSTQKMLLFPLSYLSNVLSFKTGYCSRA